MAITLTAEDTLVIAERRDLNIYNYGVDNLYPQHSVVFADNSGTLKACMDIYERFVFGNGMTNNKDFWKKKINIHGLRVDQFLRRLVRQYGIHKGFAFKVIYNGMAEIVGIVPIKFENCRLKKTDDSGIIKKIIYCDDWSKKPLNKTRDMHEYDVYNPDPEIIWQQAERAGGWKEWKGQIFYYGENGELKYPHNSFHSVLEDVATDIAIKKGKNANVSTNFLASHIMQLPFTFQEMADKMSDENKKVKAEDVKESLKESLKKYQSNENLGKLMLMENPFKDNDGKMIPFQIDKLELQNYDKINEHSEKTVKENIRQNYNIPPILLQEVSTGFSTEIFKHAYNYYNEITDYDRLILEETFVELFENWVTDVNVDLQIAHLKPMIDDTNV